MKEKFYKEKLKNCAKNAAVPDVLENIKKTDFSAYKTDEHDIVSHAATATAKSSLHRRNLFKTAWLAAAAVFVLIFAFVAVPQLAFDKTVSATVSVSVNETANYTIEVNKNSQFLDITADTNAGEKVLQNLSFGRKKLDVVLTELLKACVDNWNLTEEQLNSKISFSVDCGNSTQKANLESCCNSSMNAAKQHCRSKHGNSDHGQDCNCGSC